MGSISDKLSYLLDTKTAIRNAIIDKGVTVHLSDTFRSYAERIGEISGGPSPKINKFRYIHFRCSSTFGENKVQLSKIVFKNGNNKYLYPSGSVVSQEGLSPFASEGPENLIDDSLETKLCANINKFPFSITIDLGSDIFDPQLYSTWEWWTAYDTSSYSIRNPKEFELVLETSSGLKIIGDSVILSVNPSMDKSLAYSGTLITI